jgi:hypothetical protein
MFSEIQKYGRALDTHDLLKVIGVILMVADHIGLYDTTTDRTDLRVVGRCAAPIFFFLIGYVNHLRIRPSLIIYGCLLSITAYFLHNHVFFNILISMILIQYCLWTFPPERITTVWRCVGFIVLIPANYWVMGYLEYGTLGLLFAYSARLIALKDRQASFWLIMTLIVYTVWQSMLFKFFEHPVYIYILLTEMTLLYFAFNFYREVTFTPHKWQLPLLFISRYSLEIYFIHLFALHVMTIVSKASVGPYVGLELLRYCLN